MARPEVINDPRRMKPAPVEYAGQWVAWNRDRTAIIAHAKTMKEVILAARALGETEALFERVRRLDENLVGRS